jgi:competence protein ComEC
MEPFLEAVSPSIAIISAGYQNSFGHPHPDVVRRLQDQHVTVLRTDDEGLVTVRTDGRNLSFDTMSWAGPRQGFAPAFDLNPPTP